jgi:hypothetical protein
MHPLKQQLCQKRLLSVKAVNKDFKLYCGVEQSGSSSGS